jgi:DNA primase
MNNQEAKEEIKAQLPVEQVVGGYLPLKKAGRIYKGLCPFHGEKTPSFTVSPDRGIYKCFGCGEGGDIFDFVMKMEGLTFPEALKLLGDKAGIHIEEYSANKQDGAGSNKTRLFSLNSYIAKVWNTILTQHPKAEDARQYLYGRGLTPETITEFQIGYAPFGRVSNESLQKAKYSQSEIQQAGDPTKFQDRIVFPISDLMGKIVGFTGRLLELKNDPRASASRGPKYWNTPETPLFIKSRTVYALHLAKHAIQKEEVAILAEGQMDVIMLHQNGYKHAVASSGTALTGDQLKMIHRFAPTIAFAYDGDKAGIDATKRGIELALEADLVPQVILIPSGKDPAECLLNQPEEWKKAYENRLSYRDWLIDELYLSKETKPLAPERKKYLAKELVSWISKVPDITEQADWFLRLSAKLETSEDNLRELFRRLHPNQKVSTSSETIQARPENKPAIGGNLAETAIAILLTYPEAFPAINHQLASLRLVPATPVLQRILPLLESAPESVPLEGYLNQHFSDEERKEYAILGEELLQPYEGAEVSATWAATELTLILQRLRADAREQEKSRLAKAIKDAQELGNITRLKELFAELQKLV